MIAYRHSNPFHFIKELLVYFWHIDNVFCTNRFEKTPDLICRLYKRSIRCYMNISI